jgi:TnpA family transposase
MCRLLGLRFAPRIRDLKEKRLYVGDREKPGATPSSSRTAIISGGRPFGQPL